MTGYFQLTGSVDLMPGTYSHTFQYTLPANLPTSVNGRYGYIRYRVRVVLNFRFWPNTKFTEAFTVIKPINLNALPGIRVSCATPVFSNFEECD